MPRPDRPEPLVLGVHVGRGDVGAALIPASGRPVAMSLERLDREKCSGTATPGWPEQAEGKLRLLLDACVRTAGIDPAELRLSQVAFVGSPAEERRLASVLVTMGSRRPRVADGPAWHSIDEHLAHAASAFLVSPFDEAAVLVAGGGSGDSPDGGGPRDAAGGDGVGPGVSALQSTYLGRGARLRHLHTTYGTARAPGGLGTAYDVATFHLGFGAVGEAGKTMGLASYGAPGTFDDVRVYDVDRSGGPGRLDVRMDPRFFDWDPGWGALDPAALRAQVRATPSGFGAPREPGDPLPGPPWNDLAHHAQRALEDAMVALADDLQRTTGAANLCLAGGVALNCLANRAILERTGFRRLFVQPAASDTGLALGAALVARHLIAGSPRDWVMRDAALGRRPGEDELTEAVDAARRAGLTVGDAGAPGFAPVARLLADGAIVGWVQGGAELGPRALGQRSILMDPRVEAHRDVLNGRVKHREGFRPFAPSVLRERAADYFELPDDSPFMVLVGTATPLARARVPAIVHVDGTARVQTVTDSATPEFAQLIRAFDTLTGVPMLLNTSFNLAGEPIVDSSADALRTFLATRMDHLVLGPHLVSRQP